MVGVFVRLKLTLMRNGLRGGWQRRTGLIIGAAAAVPLAIVGFVTLAASGRNVDLNHEVAVLGCTALFVGWISMPVLGFGSDETLDPSRLALLPLSRRHLMGGLLAASAIGVAPIATLLGLSGAVAGYTSSLASLVLVTAAVLVEVALCITASRAVVTALSRMLRSRRGRDVSVILVALVALLPQLLRFALPDVNGDRTVDLSPIVGSARWLPPGLAGQAMVDARNHRLLAAAGELALAALAVAILLALWAFALQRTLTTAEATGTRKPERRGGGEALPLFPRWLPFLPRTRVGAVAARELRYVVRDPRRRVMLLYGLLMPAFALIPLLTQGQLRHPEAALAALSVTFFLGGLGALNQLGIDGPAYWTNVAAGNDPRSDLLGKNLAATIYTMPTVLVVAVALAIYGHGWAWVPFTVIVGLAALGVELGVGNVVSVLAPQAVPDTGTNMWAQRSGQGCANGVINLGAMVTELGLFVPLIVAIIVAVLWPLTGVVTAPLAVVYGTVIWRLGLRIAVERVWWRLPELLEAVSAKQAA